MSEAFYDFKHMMPLLSQIEFPSKLYQKEVPSSSKSHLTYQTYDSFFTLSLIGYKKCGKTFAAEKLFGITDTKLKYSSTEGVCIKLGTKLIYKENFPFAVIDGPGTPIYEDKKNGDDEILSQHFMENFMMYASNIVVLVLEHSLERNKRENDNKLQWITNLVKKNKRIFLIHNLKKVSNHEELNDSLDEIIRDYELEDETQYIKKNVYKYHPARFEYFLSKSDKNSHKISHFFFIWEKENMSEINAKSYNLKMAELILKACKSENSRKKLDYCKLFNEFFLKNYSLYFESEQDLLPETYLFSLNFEKNHGFFVFNEDFADHCKYLQKPLFDSHGNLFQRKLEYFTTEIDENETRYQIFMPGCKNNLTVLLLKLQGEQYIRIIGSKLSEKDLIFNTNKKKTMFALLKDSLDDLKNQEKRVEKLLRVSKKSNEFFLIDSSIAYLNGILTFVLTKKMQKNVSSDPNEQNILNLLSEIETLEEQDITIFEEIESFAQRKTYHAYYVVKRINVILSTFPASDVETLQELKQETEHLRDLQAKLRDSSQQIIRDFGIFKLFDRKTDKFKVARLFEAYSLTLRRRMDIKPYSDQELGYILLDLCRGLLELEENSNELTVGNLNSQTIGVFPVKSSANQEKLLYKYKFFDFQLSCVKESFSSTRKHPFNYLIRTVRTHRENTIDSLENPELCQKLDCLTELEALTRSPLLTNAEVCDFLETYASSFETPNEEFVVFRDRDRVLVEMDILKSIFLPDPYQKSQDQELRMTLAPKNKQNVNLLKQSCVNLSQTLREEVKQFTQDFAKSLKISHKLNMIELETLGVGGFCRVCKAFDFDSQKYIALKFFSPEKSLEFSREELEAIKEEYEVLLFVDKLQKPEYFLRFYGGNWDKAKKTVIFKMQNGVCNMREILNHRGSYREREILYILAQLLEILAFLEDRGVAHRDIKPENFFLLDEGAYYKVGDFGNSLKIEEKDKKTVGYSTLLGCSPQYTSPEVHDYMKQDYESDEEYDPFLADVYSLGVTILVMMGLKAQEIEKIKGFEPETLRNELKIFKSQEYPFVCGIIELFIQKNPQNRRRFKEILQIIENETKEKPNDKELVEIIERNRRENPDPYEKVKNLVKFARLYYELGNRKEAEKYAISALEDVELTESCYEMEILRIKGLLARSLLNYPKAKQYYKSYDQILGVYKELVGIKDEENEEEQLNFEGKWRKAFETLKKNEKEKVLKKFWTIQIT